MSDKFNRDAYDVAWNWFRVHADQRLELFKTYIVWVVALSAGYVSLIQIKANEAAILVTVVGILLGWVFKKLDQRVSSLLKLGEEALDAEEARLAIATSSESIRLVKRANEIATQQWSYRKSFNLIYAATSILFCLGLVWSAWSRVP